MTNPVHIVAARRTPIGRFIGGLAELSSSALDAVAVRQVVADSGVDPATIDEVITGQVLTAGAGMNPARQSAIGGGLPISVPAFTVNKVCGSGLKAIHLGAQAIGAGDAELIIAGGQESMTQAPHLLPGRRASKLGDITATDSIMVDGLVDATLPWGSPPKGWRRRSASPARRRMLSRSPRMGRPLRRLRQAGSWARSRR